MKVKNDRPALLQGLCCCHSSADGATDVAKAAFHKIASALATRCLAMGKGKVVLLIDMVAMHAQWYGRYQIGTGIG